MPWLSPEVRYRQLSMGQARSQLGDDEFERAYAEGRDRPPEEAMDSARNPQAVPVEVVGHSAARDAPFLTNEVRLGPSFARLIASTLFLRRWHRSSVVAPARMPGLSRSGRSPT